MSEKEKQIDRLIQITKDDAKDKAFSKAVRNYAKIVLQDLEEGVKPIFEELEKQLTEKERKLQQIKEEYQELFEYTYDALERISVNIAEPDLSQAQYIFKKSTEFMNERFKLEKVLEEKEDEYIHG